MYASRVANAVQLSTLPGVALVPRCEIGGERWSSKFGFQKAATGERLLMAGFRGRWSNDGSHCTPVAAPED